MFEVGCVARGAASSVLETPDQSLDVIQVQTARYLSLCNALRTGYAMDRQEAGVLLTGASAKLLRANTAVAVKPNPAFEAGDGFAPVLTGREGASA